MPQSSCSNDFRCGFLLPERERLYNSFARSSRALFAKSVKRCSTTKMSSRSSLSLLRMVELERDKGSLIRLWTVLNKVSVVMAVVKLFTKRFFWRMLAAMSSSRSPIAGGQVNHPSQSNQRGSLLPWLLCNGIASFD